MAARRRRTRPEPPGPSCKPKSQALGHHQHRKLRSIMASFPAAAIFPPPPRRFSQTPWWPSLSLTGPLALFPWTLQVMRGINAMTRLAAASWGLGGNCFHTTFTGESGRRSRKPRQGFMRWDSPLPPPHPGPPPPVGGAESCCGRVMQVICYPSLA